MGRGTRSRTNTNTQLIMPTAQAFTDFQSRFDFDRYRLFIHALQIFWVGLVYYLEVGVFNRAFYACHWPGPELVPAFTFTPFASVMTHYVSRRTLPFV